MSIALLDRVTLAYDASRPVLREVDLSIEPGELVALVGPSGSGKSTLLNILGLALPPTSGPVTFLGRQVTWRNERGLTKLRREKIGFIFQFFNLLPELNARENIMLTALLNGQSASSAGSRADSLLAQVGLEGFGDRAVQQLSGGEQQRVSICRALAPQPALLLADEPTGSLDSASGTAVLELLRQIAAAGTAVVMATHNEQALKYAARVVRISDGQITSKADAGH